MGGSAPITTDGGGGGDGNGGGGISADAQAIIDALNSLFGDGGSKTNTILITLGNANTPTVLSVTSLKVRKAIIQNISSTDIITLVATSDGNGKAAAIVNYQGTILNPAGTSNQGGGTYPAGNIDLNSITVQQDTTNALVISVTYEY